MQHNNPFQQKLMQIEQQLKNLTESRENAVSLDPLINIYSNIKLEEALLISNIDHLQNNILPKLANKIETLRNEVNPLEQKKAKIDAMIQSFKNLSNELDTKMETFLKESKETQKSHHETRDELTQSFSARVGEIGVRLKSLENRKIQLSEQSNILQNDLKQCMADFTHYDSLFQELMKSPLSPTIMKLLNPDHRSSNLKHKQTDSARVAADGDDDDDSTNIIATDTADEIKPEVKETESSTVDRKLINSVSEASTEPVGKVEEIEKDNDNDNDVEEEEEETVILHKQQLEESRMIHEDYLSTIGPLEQMEAKYQKEINQFIDRFQELNLGLTASNQSLCDHEKRVKELETTLQSLELQQVKGKHILSDIKKVLATESRTCDQMEESVNSIKNKNKKYSLMSNAFEEERQSLVKQIEFYEASQSELWSSSSSSSVTHGLVTATAASSDDSDSVLLHDQFVN